MKRGKENTTPVPTLSGEEPFTVDDCALDYCLKDFWSWYASNLLHAPLRGAMAEFVIAKALGIPCDTCRNTWASVDIEYNGVKIEVKSSSFLQANERDELSRLSFSISKHSHFTEVANERETMHHADLYVFALFGCKDRKEANTMKLEQWTFYIVPTSTIEQELGEQKNISYNTLLRLMPSVASYNTLKTEVDKLCHK